MLRTAFFAAAALALTACASTPAYAPAATPTGVGYSETQIEANRFFVTYRAGGATDAALLQDYALLRAADIALERGRDWFWVDRRSLDSLGSGYSGPSVGIGIGAGSFGGSSGVSGSVGVQLPIGGGASGQRARAATLEVRLGEGARPDDPNTYDARSVSTNIRSRIAARR